MSIEQEEPNRYCKSCGGKLQKIVFTGFAGKGDPRPYKHALPQKVPCAMTTIKEDETTEEDSGFDFYR